MLSDDPRPVRPFNPSAFVGTVAYDGATPIYVASIAMHPGGELALINLVGHDTAISSRSAAFYVGKEVLFVPHDSLRDDPFWSEPPGLTRVHGTYRNISKKLPGLRNTVNWMIVATNLRIGFNLQTQPIDLIHRIMEEEKRKKNPSAVPAPLRQDTQVKPTYRYVVANAGDAAPSFHAVIGTLVGMRVVMIRPRQQATHLLARHWANELWNRGVARSMIIPLQSLGIACWGVLNDTFAWNAVICEGVRHGWLPLPRTSADLPPERLAMAAD